MIRRIVKLEFQENHCSDFIEFASKIKDEIRNFEGCRELEILRDTYRKNVFFTCSIWENNDALEKYRKSEFFLQIWPQAKKWFSEKPKAWSVEII